MSNKNINVKISPQFTEADTRENINSGDNIKTVFGKIRKWLSDLKPVAFSGSYNDLSDKPDLPESGVFGVKGNAETEYRTGNVNLTPANIGAATSTQGTKADSAVQTIKMNGNAVTKTSGVVDLGTVITAHQDISGKADKSATVSTITYDTTNKKLTKTINGTTSDVVTTAKLKTDMALSKSDVGLGNVGNFKAVSTVASQGLTDTEKANARANIGAGTSSFSGSYNDLSNKPTIPAAVAVKGNAESTYRTGNVNLTPANIGAATTAQGTKADSAVQTIQIGGTSQTKTDGIVNLPAYPTKSSLGLSNVENKSSATIRGELTSSNVTTALGYTPANSTSLNNYLPLSGGTMTGDIIIGNHTIASSDSTTFVSNIDANDKYAQMISWTNSTSVGLQVRSVDTDGKSIARVLIDATGGTGSGLYINNEKVHTKTVRYDTNAQNLTDTQKSNARTNIGAGTSNLAIGTTSTTAAAGNHGHTDLGLRGYCVTISDWNSATTNGWYMASSASNAPNGDTGVWYFGRAIAHNAKYVFQEAWQFTHTSDVRKSKRYTRMCLNGTWGAWTRDNIGLYDSGKWIEGDKYACVVKNNKENSGKYNPVIDVATVNGHWSIGTLGSTGNNNLYFVQSTDATSSSNTFLSYCLEGASSVSSMQSYNILTTKNYTSYCATPSQLSGKQDTITKTTATPTYVSNSLFGSDQIARLRYVKYDSLFAYLKVNLSLSSSTTTDFVTVATLPFTVAEDIMVCAPLQGTTANATLLITGGTNAIKLYKNGTTSGWFRQAIFIPIE